MYYLYGKRFLTGTLFALALLGFSFSKSSTANAQPQYWHSNYGGVPVGWGWWGPGVILNWPLYGYTYWPYYQQPRYATFAAISYSKSTDRFGVAWGESTRSEAISDATGYCGEGDCQPVVWVQGGCAAVSSGEKGASLGWAFHTERWVADQYANTACRRGSVGANPKILCKQRAWVCSF